MLQNKIKLIILSVFLLTFSSCDKTFEELEINENSPTSVPAALVLKGIEFDMYNNTGRAFGPEMRWNQFYCSNYNYYATNEYQWTETPNHFFTLKNIVKMEEEAKKLSPDAVNPYSAMAKFFKAFFYDQMSKRVGDLPLSEALKGIENLAPKYDSQKQVYMQILKWLDESNADLGTLINKGQTLGGDFYYGGDLKKWQKAVNAFQLRVLVSLSKKEADTDLNIKVKFAEIVNNPTKYPVFTALNESLQFNSNNFNKYPSNPDNFGFDATRQNMSKAYVERLTDLKDPRVMKTCEPVGALLKSGKLPSDYASYVGASSGEDLADMSLKAGTDNGSDFTPGQYSFQNRSRYYSNYVGEATFILGYPELCFNMAEGLNRGWATATTAQTWYENGVKASMEFYGIKDGANTMTYSRNGSRDAADQRTFSLNFSTTDYFAQANVKYEAGAAGLEKILTQKYVAFFMNSGMEAYFNWRRTGFPKFYTGVGNGNSSRIALRWLYPVSEITTNSTNYKAAVASQYGGKDDINESVWMIK